MGIHRLIVFGIALILFSLQFTTTASLRAQGSSNCTRPQAAFHVTWRHSWHKQLKFRADGDALANVVMRSDSLFAGTSGCVSIIDRSNNNDSQGVRNVDRPMLFSRPQGRGFSSPAQTRLAPTEGNNCQLVELFPGYPGYRGYVSGVLGAGETACLVDLIALDPTFDKPIEDRANREAAKRLGIPGDLPDWTWENWMAIEAERSMVPTCFACLWVNGTPLPASQTRPYYSDDPRVKLGRFGQRNVAQRFVQDRGLSPSLAERAPTDDELRAIIGMMNPGRYLTAPELLTASDDLLQFWYGIGKYKGGGFLDTRTLYHDLISVGGYAPTSKDNTDSDQLFVIVEGVYALEPAGLGYELTQHLVQLIVNEADDWYLEKTRDPTNTPSLGQWLRNQGAINWY